MNDLVVTPEIINNARAKCKAYRDFNRANLYARATPFTPPETRVDENLHNLVNSNNTSTKFINGKYIGGSIVGLAAIGAGILAYKKFSKQDSEEENHGLKNESVKRKLKLMKVRKKLKK